MHVSCLGVPCPHLYPTDSCSREPSHWAVAQVLTTYEQLHAAKCRGAGAPPAWAGVQHQIEIGTFWNAVTRNFWSQLECTM